MCRLRLPWFSVDCLARALGVALPLAGVGDADPDASGLVVLGIEQGHVGDVDRPLLLDHATGLAGTALRLLGTLVALDDVQVLDEHPLGLRVRPDHAPGLALVLAGLDQHGVVGLDSHPLRHGYRTSGARDTILMKFLSRSSRATGPKMR